MIWTALLEHMLARLVRIGRLEITYPNGRRRVWEGKKGPEARVTIQSQATLRRLVLNPSLALGEGYMDETIVPDDLDALLALALINLESGLPTQWMRAQEAMRRALRGITQRNRLFEARRNAAHHYDLSDALYALFLDADRQYSCAYFRTPNLTLEEAQEAKKAHIAAKLCLKPGLRVLDIGCGWGGLALTLAQKHGVRVVGITLSEEQAKVAAERARQAGLTDRIEIRLQDYRDVSETFDRIVSVGMFEHVGLPNYGRFFEIVGDRLTEEGVALIHTIARAAPPGSADPWIDRYIFPGGYIPSLSELAPAIERAHLWLCDLEVWRLHYAETLAHWRRRFEANADRAAAIYDARFVRMWRYYLAASEATFRYGRNCVFQLQLARKRDAVPLTRDYLYRPEELRAASLSAARSVAA